MNKGRLIVTGIILSIVYLAMEYFTHQRVFAEIYQQTATIWRPEAEMMTMSWMMWLGEVIFAFMFGVVFAAGYDRIRGGFGQGFRFGFYMALLLGPITGLVWYVVLPIPSQLAIGWSVATFVQMWILGMVAGLVYRPKRA